MTALRKSYTYCETCIGSSENHHAKYLFPGANPLLQLLYETDNPTQQAENLGENPSVWQYRERISVDHLMQMFARSGQNCPVLQQFLEEVL